MKKSFLLALLFFIVSTHTASAQVSIGKFYSQGTYKNKPLDWVEIVNNSDSKVNLKDYSIKDSNLSETNTYGFEGDTYLDPGGSCTKEVGQILNKDKDIIYIFNGSEKIFCLEYGGSSTDCNQAGEIGVSPEKPVVECSSETISTSAPVQTSTSKPTPTPSQMPIIEIIDTPLPTRMPQVKSASVETVGVQARPESPTPEPEVSEKGLKDKLAYFLIIAGVGVSGFGVSPLLKELFAKYNERYVQDEYKPPDDA